MLEDDKAKLLIALQEGRDQLKQQKTDQADIYYYLNKKCDESFEVIASLEEQLLHEQSDREVSEKSYENRLEEMRLASSNTESKLQAKISDLESRLEMLNNFSEMKDELTNKVAALNATLEEERAQFARNFEMAENRYLVEREKLRRTFEAKKEALEKQLEGTVDMKLSGKVRKTQVMNVLIKKELENQSKHAEKLLEINEDIVLRDKDLKMELQLARSMQEEMATKLAAYQRTVRQLNDKVGSLEAGLRAAAEEREREQLQQRDEASSLQAEMSRLRRRANKEGMQLDDMWLFLAGAYRRIRRAAEGRRQLAAQQQRPAPSAASASDGLSELSDPETAGDHEHILSELVREVLAKYPKLLPRGPHPSFPEPRPSPEPWPAGETPYIITGVSGQGLGLGSVGSRDSLLPPPPSQSSGSLRGSRSKHRLPRFQSVAVQTEGQVALYPPGSRWLRPQPPAEGQQWAADRSSQAPESVSSAPTASTASQSQGASLWGLDDQQSQLTQRMHSNHRPPDKGRGARNTRSARARSVSARGRSQQQSLKQALQRAGASGPGVAARIALKFPNLAQNQINPPTSRSREEHLGLGLMQGGSLSVATQPLAGSGEPAASPAFSLGSMPPHPPASAHRHQPQGHVSGMAVSGLGFVSPLQLPRL